MDGVCEMPSSNNKKRGVIRRVLERDFAGAEDERLGHDVIPGVWMYTKAPGCYRASPDSAWWAFVAESLDSWTRSSPDHSKIPHYKAQTDDDDGSKPNSQWIIVLPCRHVR